MKLFKIFLIAAITFVTSFARSQTTQNLNLRTGNGSLFRYGWEGLYTTTDSGTYTMVTFPIGNNESGMLEAQVVGFDSSHGGSVTGSKIVRYVKTGGTLTLGSVTNVLAVETDLSGATFTMDASSNNIRLRITGDTASTIKWIANVRWINKKT
jgi:hypothetical protein